MQRVIDGVRSFTAQLRHFVSKRICLRLRYAQFNCQKDARWWQLKYFWNFQGRWTLFDVCIFFRWVVVQPPTRSIRHQASGEIWMIPRPFFSVTILMMSFWAQAEKTPEKIGVPANFASDPSIFQWSFENLTGKAIRPIFRLENFCALWNKCQETRRFCSILSFLNDLLAETDF